VKGCSRALLVGDHVQLRATVQQSSLLTGYDVPLFERHFDIPSRDGVAKVMLDTQYRMHRNICAFSAAEFYDNRLKTAVRDSSRPLPASLFPWPPENRAAWVECAANEDLGCRSKANMGQVELCKRVIQLLRTPPSNATCPSDSSSPSTCGSKSIAILTPYTRQKEALASVIPDIEISSIDGFQGREADVVVFVTVRSNAHSDMGFLTDMRRLNVVMTRAKAGTIVIGNKNTLAGANLNPDEVKESRKVWRRLLHMCAVVKLPEP
jgi:superfamily I DNA and/or RNA helicase